MTISTYFLQIAWSYSLAWNITGNWIILSSFQPYLKCDVSGQLRDWEAKLLNVFGFGDDFSECSVKVNQVLDFLVVAFNTEQKGSDMKKIDDTLRKD